MMAASTVSFAVVAVVVVVVVVVVMPAMVATTTGGGVGAAAVVARVIVSMGGTVRICVGGLVGTTPSVLICTAIPLVRTMQPSRALRTSVPPLACAPVDSTTRIDEVAMRSMMRKSPDRRTARTSDTPPKVGAAALRSSIEARSNEPLAASAIVMNPMRAFGRNVCGIDSRVMVAKPE